MNVTEWSVEDHVKRRAAREARGLGREVDVGVEGYTIRLLVTLRAREAVEKVGYHLRWVKVVKRKRAARRARRVLVG